MRAAILGLGVVGGFGCGVKELENAAHNSVCASQLLELETIYGLTQVLGHRACVDPLEQRIGRRFLRRSTRFMQLALLGALLALEDAPHRDVIHAGQTGIILGTGFGATCNTLGFRSLSPQDESNNISPISFSHSVDNVAAASIAALLEKHAPNITINHFDMSVPLAFMTALSWLRSGWVDHVLVGGVDEFSKVSAYHQSQCSAHGAGGQENGLGVGEGSAFFLLAPEDGLSAPYGYVREARTSTDRVSVMKPEPRCLYVLDHGFRLTSTQALLWESLQTCESATYMGLYGYLPVGLGFALAVAALSQKNGVVYPSVTERDRGFGLQEPTSLERRKICCLRPGQAGEWGMVLLESE